MTTVIVLFRNAPRLAGQCLESLLVSHDATAAAGGAEYVLIDDASDAGRAVMPALLEFRARVAPAEVRIIRFKRQMHYTHGLAYALSAAKGDDVLFVSHDMILTPDSVSAMREVAATDSAIGIVRPTSQHMDWAKKFVAAPPSPAASLQDLLDFSATARRQFGTDAVDWPMLIGDAMLIRRAVIDRIGVFDTRYFGFMGDIDYGVRAHRAGFRHVIARGAWLHHEGAGTARESAAAGGPAFDQQGREMLTLVESAYLLFRQIWGESNLPPHFRDMKREHFDRLNASSPPEVDLFQAPLALTPDVAELI